ncbi:chromosome segregation ATPase [Gloeothece verrucosa]|uniref:Chromosome segregation ATPase-like protein n=1 Tax=Gloeothece verrucosa (strain PCC 7822) TaxID=497965 RepID=E0UI56_GLOV7|nr:chromosome segregation ATPase [Gloeothece verrucosa]ADN15708.1 Chromosome segregation ATPase-like protein [Gloeothece verrucosa PCC 7822]
MNKRLQPLIYLIPWFCGGLAFTSSYLLTANALANPIEITPSGERNRHSISEFPFEQDKDENLKLTTFSKPLLQIENSNSCRNFTLIEEEPLSANSSCAADLAGVSSISEYNFATLQTLITQESTPNNIPESPKKTEQDKPEKEKDKWHFSFQPYATIPVTAYGTATARGRTVSYSLSLGELLDDLRMTASGRVEAWKGRLGFIMDGYYVSLKGVDSMARTRSRVPNTINAINFLLSKDVNTNLQKIANSLDKNVDNLQKLQTLQQSDAIQNLEQTVQNFKATAGADAQALRELEQKIQTIKQTASIDAEALRELEQKYQNFKATVSQDAEALRELDQKYQNFKATVSQDAEDLRELKQKVQNFQDTVAQDAETLREIQEKIDNFKDIVGQDGERFKALIFNLQQVEGINLDRQELKELITLNNQDRQRFPIQPELNERLQQFATRLDNLGQLQQNLISSKEGLEQASQKIDELKTLQQDIFSLNNRDIQRFNTKEKLETKLQNIITKIEDLQQLQQDLIASRERLEQASQQIQKLRALQDSGTLQQLDTEIQNAKTVLDQNIEYLNKLKQFQENREVQQLASNSETELQFDQGIYDFALSYNLGDLPMYEHLDKPSNQTFPRIWFQPIAGVRLNDINIKIDETINLKLSSSLIKFEGTFQETFQQGRTWFDPLVGGKLGVQISEPLTLWVRGDYAGFGLAGDTDYSWNVFFGVDWWIRRHLSLQLAYRFYEINYRVGSGNNAYGYSQNLNGPFISATFHF